MKKMKFLVLLLASLSLFSCTQKESNEVVIGLYGPFSGGSAPLGMAMRNGFQMAEEKLNASGGILGKKLKLVIRDDESKNERGAQIAQELIEKEKVIALLGPINTGVADASTKYANQKKIPQMISSSSGAKVNDYFKETSENYIFRFFANDETQSQLIVKEVIETRGFKRIAVICDDTNFGQAGRERIVRHLSERKMTPVYEGKFKLKDTDMTPQLQQAKSAGAEVIVAYGLGPEVAALANSKAKLGWNAPIIGAWTLSMSSFIKNAGPNAEGTSMPMSFIEATDHPAKVKEFLESYHKKFNEKPISAALSAVQSYDSLLLLAQAIEQAKSFEGPKIKAALENLDKPFDGLTGTFTKPFSPSDHEAMKMDHLKIGIVKGGVVVPKSE